MEQPRSRQRTTPPSPAFCPGDLQVNLAATALKPRAAPQASPGAPSLDSAAKQLQKRPPHEQGPTGRSQVTLPFSHQVTTNHVQLQDRIPYAAPVVHVGHIINNADAETYDAGRVDDNEYTVRAAQLNCNGIQPSGRQSSVSPTVKPTIALAPVDNRLAVGHEVNREGQEKQLDSVTNGFPSGEAATGFAPERPSQEAAVCDRHDSVVPRPCSEYPERCDGNPLQTCNASLAKVVSPWSRDRGSATNDRNPHSFFCSFSPRRVLQIARPHTVDQSSGPTLHACCNEARNAAGHACGGVLQNSDREQHPRIKGLRNPPIVTWWETCRRFSCVPVRCASKLKGKFSTTMDRAFSRQAMLVYDYKWHFIVMSFTISALMAVGLLFRKHENDMYKLYSFSGAPSYKIKDQFLSHFPRFRTSYIIAYSDYDSLKPDTLLALHDIDQQIRNVTLDRDAVTVDEYGDPIDRHAAFDRQAFPATVTFDHICARDSWGDCNVVSVLDMYTSPRSWGRPIVSRKWPIVVNFRTKKAYRADAMLGNIRAIQKPQGDSMLHIIQNATAFGIRYDLMGENGWEIYSAALEERIEEIVFQSHIPGMKLALRTERSISDDLIKSSQLGRWDSILLTIAVVVVLMYTLLVNSSLSYRTKTLPAIMGVLSTLLGYGGGAGFIYLCGVLHTPPAEATPFLVLGIGVDNAFVLINSYSLTFLIEDPRERIRHTTRDAGLAITCTTLTSVAALIIGAGSPYASISMFCVITAFCLFWSYVMALTFFLGWLAVDAQREANQLYRGKLRQRLSEGKPSMSASKTVPENARYLETGEKTRPDTILTPAEAENTMNLASSSPQNVEAHSILPSQNVEARSILPSQKSGSRTLPQATTSYLCAVDANLSAAEDHNLPCVSDVQNRHNTLQMMVTAEGENRVQADSGRPPSTRPVDCEGQHQQEIEGQQASQDRPAEEGPHVCEQTKQGSQSGDRHISDGGEPLPASAVCVLRRECEASDCIKESVPLVDRELFFQHLKYMSTYQLASLMAFRPYLEKTLKYGEPDRTIWVQLAIPVQFHHSGGDTDNRKPDCNKAGEGQRRKALRRLKALKPTKPSTEGRMMIEAHPSSSSPEPKYKAGPRSSEGEDTGNDVLLCPVEETEKADEMDSPHNAGQQSTGCDHTDASERYLVMSGCDLKQLFDTYLREPEGNVGRLGRAFLINYYCRTLAKPWVQALIVIFFAAICGASIYGFTKIQPGITVDEICPKDSYLRTFFEVRSRYFSTLGEEITVFFPEPERWEEKSLQNNLLEVHDAIYSSNHAVAINNGMYQFIKQKQQDLIDGDKEDFLRALYFWLHNDLVGKQFRTHFVFSFPPSLLKEDAPLSPSRRASQLPDSLVSWKFVYWMPHVENTSVLYEWLQETRSILQDASTHFHGLVYTPLAILWESDPYIFKCTVSNLLYALVAIVLMTVLLIPNFFSMLIVSLIVFLVDLALCGFMAIWGLRLNMLTMVILLLAIGYSVDTTTHVLNAFTRCCGRTRTDRMVETLVLMGNAIANGMLSTLIAVFFLKASDKFVLEVFFKMMVLVLAFAFGFGFVFLPVVLQLFGPMSQNEQVIRLLDGAKDLHDGKICPQDRISDCKNLKPPMCDSYAV